MSKYRAVPTVIDGIRFASKREANRYCELKLLLRDGAITDLELQPRYPIVVNGKKIADYVADFQYNSYGTTVCEDVKGYKTRVYKLKKKLVEAIHGITVVEVL